MLAAGGAAVTEVPVLSGVEKGPEVPARVPEGELSTSCGAGRWAGGCGAALLPGLELHPRPVLLADGTEG